MSPLLCLVCCRSFNLFNVEEERRGGRRGKKVIKAIEQVLSHLNLLLGGKKTSKSEGLRRDLCVLDQFSLDNCEYFAALIIQKCFYFLIIHDKMR